MRVVVPTSHSLEKDHSPICLGLVKICASVLSSLYGRLDLAPTAAIAVAHLTIPKHPLSSDSLNIAEFDLRPFAEERRELHQLHHLASRLILIRIWHPPIYSRICRPEKDSQCTIVCKCEIIPQSATFKPPIQIFEKKRKKSHHT